MGIIFFHGTIHELHLAAMVAQFFDQENLVDIFAGNSVGRSKQNQFKRSHCRLFTQPVQTGSVQRCTTIAIILVDVLF